MPDISIYKWKEMKNYIHQRKMLPFKLDLAWKPHSPLDQILPLKEWKNKMWSKRKTTKTNFVLSDRNKLWGLGEWSEMSGHVHIYLPLISSLLYLCFFCTQKWSKTDTCTLLVEWHCSVVSQIRSRISYFSLQSERGKTQRNGCEGFWAVLEIYQKRQQKLSNFRARLDI